MPVWQEFYTRHKDANIEILSVAIDAQADKPRPYVEKAGAAFTTVIDEANTLSQLLSFKAIPNGLLLDPDGVLQYRKFSGFDIRRQEYADLVGRWAADPSPEWLAQQMQEDNTGGPQHQAAIALFQQGLLLYRDGKVAEALDEWKSARDLEPDNFVIRKQIWAIENPDRFYNGEVDYDWQREQIARGR